MKYEVLEKAAHGVIGEGRDYGGLQAEAAFEAAGDVVFAAAFVDIEGAGSRDAAIAGIES